MSVQKLIESCTNVSVCNGPAGRSKRVGKIVEGLFDLVPGNAVEIGGGSGHTTILLIRAAVRKGRLVVVIDPWEEKFLGRNNVYTLKEYMSVINGYAMLDENFNEQHHLLTAQLKSQTPEAKKLMLDAKPLAFGFIDGARDYDGVMSDLRALSAAKTAVICVDDTSHEREVSRAFIDFIGDGPPYVVCGKKGLLESYLVRVEDA